MRHLRVLFIFSALAVLAVGAGIAFAALGDTESASGSVNVSSVSADLYICEPGDAVGPACGPDDNDGGEAIFEDLEDLRPGDVVQWDIRLKNVGPVPFSVVSAGFNSEETSDPGADCRDDVLHPVGPTQYSWEVLSILGKAGDPLNDNDSNWASDYPRFRPETGGGEMTIHIEPGDYEDVRLRLTLPTFDTINCDGNSWNVTWEFNVN